MKTLTTHIAYKTEIVGQDVVFKYILYANDQYITKGATVWGDYTQFMNYMKALALDFYGITIDQVNTYVPIELHIDF